MKLIGLIESILFDYKVKSFTLSKEGFRDFIKGVCKSDELTFSMILYVFRNLKITRVGSNAYQIDL